jgi:hypothetical protein
MNKETLRKERSTKMQTLLESVKAKKTEAFKMAKSRIVDELPREVNYSGWESYKLGIQVVAWHLRAMLKKYIKKQGWVTAELALEYGTNELFQYYMQCDGNPVYQSRTSMMNEVSQSEYFVLDALRTYAAAGYGNPEAWHQYLTAAAGFHDNITEDPDSAIDVRLGADLHTTPADASADTDVTRDGLATRLDRLRDF